MTSSVSVYSPVYYCSKSILEEYCEISSLLTEEIVKVHQEISAAVEQIDPLAEYQHFIDAYRSGSKLSSSVTVVLACLSDLATMATDLRRLLRRVWSSSRLYWRSRKTYQPMRFCGTR